MRIKINNIRNIFQNGHLNDEGIALWADALKENREKELPDELKGHVDQCLRCKKQILELYKDLKELDGPEETSNTNQGEGKTKPMMTKTVYRVAAIIIALLAVGAIILFSTKAKVDSQQLFAEYFKPYPNVITTKGMNEELLSAGMYYYDMAKYDSALLFYNKILETKPERQDVLFYKGICLLATDKPETAMASLIKVADTSPYKSQSEWYLALAYLKSGNRLKANEILLKKIQEGTASPKEERLLHRIE